MGLGEKVECEEVAGRFVRIESSSDIVSGWRLWHRLACWIEIAGFERELTDQELRVAVWVIEVGMTVKSE